MIDAVNVAVAQPDDEEALVAFLAANGGEEWRGLARDYVACMFSSDYRRPTFLTAKAAGRIVGAVCYSEEFFTAHVWGLSWLNVHPDWRNKGIGTKLTEACVEAIQARISGPVTLILNAYESAAPLYEKLGFVRGGLDAAGEPFMMRILGNP